MADVQEARAPPNWRRVIYVLLTKSRKDDEFFISKRREIALMPQDFKLLTAMIKASVYSRVVGRQSRQQLGWLRGFGAADAGIQVAAAIQQARRTESPLYLIYVDLKTFFPKINREVCRVAELWKGLPKEAIDQVAFIYGSGQREEACVSCQYDTAACKRLSRSL
jgi:hypothetical protein